MSVRQGRPSRFWGAIVGVALLLLGIILAIVILLSARLRQPVQITVLRPAPAERPAAPATPRAAHPAPAASRSSASPHHAPARAAAAADRREKPSSTARPPVKVIEKVVKVVEKQVKVIEKPVKVVEKPARRRTALAASSDRASLPTRDSSSHAALRPRSPSDRAPASTRAPSDADTATGTFEETGLPSQLTYAGQVWNASDLVQDLSADLLAVDGRTVDGHTVYHDEDAASPFPQIYVKVTGETDQYVRYVRTSS